jgi:TRAP-type C4-dicarboxylate transport system permease small subunit
MQGLFRILICDWRTDPMTPRIKGIRIDYWLAASMLFTMAAIAFINVLSRYLFHFSFAATEEITINLFVWMTVVGTAIAFERGSQLGMVTLFNIFPKRYKKLVILLGASLSTILFLLVDYYMLQAIYEELTLFQATSAALDIPVWIYYAGVPVLSVFVFAGIYRQAAQHLAQLESDEDH